MNPATNDIYLGGKNSSIPGTDLIEHLSPTGSEDTAFGSSGLVTAGTSASYKNQILFDSASGKILMMANGTGNTTDARVVRVLTSGALDSTFATAGAAQITIATGGSSYYSSHMLMEPGTGNILASRKREHSGLRDPTDQRLRPHAVHRHRRFGYHFRHSRISARTLRPLLLHVDYAIRLE